MKIKLLIIFVCSWGLGGAQRPLGDSIIENSIKMIKKDIVIFGKGIPSFLGERTGSIQIISKNETKLLPIRTVNEALSFVSGLDMRQRGVNGIQGDLSIRGGTFEQNIILINGFKLVDPQTGHHALNLPVLLSNIRNIEIYKGSGTRIFGQNAMTGAVNFVTSPSEKNTINAQMYGAQFGGLGTQFSLGVPIGKLKQTFSVGFDKSNGHWYNSDFSNQQLFYDAALPISNTQTLSALVGYTDRSFGANGYYTNAFPDQWESTQMALAGISHHWKINKLTFLTKVSLRTHRDEFRLKRFTPSFYTNKHWSEVVTFEETAQLKTEWGLTGFGAEYRMENLSSSNLGIRDRSYFSAFLDHKLKLLNDKLILVGNVHFFSLDMNGIRHNKVLPGFEASFSIKQNVIIFGNFGQSYRAPSYTELFYQDPSNLGNPNLQPEYATNSELGFDFQRKIGEKSRFNFETALYIRNVTNMIDWLRYDPTYPWQPVNISGVLFKGLEANIKYLYLGSNKVSIREWSVSYSYIDASHQFFVAIPETQSRYAFSGLRNQLISRITFNVLDYINATLTYRGVERVGAATYSLLDAKIIVNASPSFSLFMEVNNLLNIDYVEAGYVQMPNRWGKIGLICNFNDL